MGKTYVALYDENMKRVMMVLLGDSRSGSEKGYLNVYFYPQDSSYGYRSSGYIYSSFRKTAELWWGPFQGGHGAVYASIDGQSDGYPIAECDNASRVIKYVAVLGYCYSSCEVVEMRIHDIGVVADLNRHDPTGPDPERSRPFDGTCSGTTESDRGRAFVAQYEDIAVGALTMAWLLPWPALEFTCNLIVDALEFHLVFTVDILGTLTPGGCTFVQPVLEAMTTEEQEGVVTKVMGLSTIQTLNAIIIASGAAAMFFATFQLLPGAQAAYTIAMTTWTVATMLLIYTLAEYYLNGLLTAIEAGSALIALIWTIFTAGTQISEQGLLGKALSFLIKYRGDPLPEWGFHTTFYWCARVLVLLLGVAVAAGIVASFSEGET
ncbi:MAG: hypothetical protein DRO93_09670 [Candidatus Thorarchaeota archaeon]|nr:MAG: hypothetical protein DRO93_09670 [Candidatus Thorarchaeota archaeon]